MKTSYGRSAARLLLCLLAMVPVAVNAAVTASLSLGVLTISLGAASDVAVVDVVAGNVVVRDGAAVQKASIAMASLTGLTLTGNGLAGQAVILNGTLTLPGAVTVSAVESITHNANYTAGSYSIVANRNIATFGEIHTTAGGVTMQANLAGTGSGNFYGISLQGTQVTTANDFIAITARGGDGGVNNYAVVLFLGATVQANGNGSVNLNGTGGGGGSQGIGVIISDPGTVVSSDTGSVLIEGHGGTATSGNPGVWLQQDAVISSSSGLVVVSGEGNNDYGVVVISGVSVLGTGIVAFSDNATDQGLAIDTGTTVSGGSVTYAADQMILRATTTATSSALIRSAANNVPVRIAATGPAGTLVLDPAYFALITTPQLNISASTFTGGIEVATSFAAPAVGELVLLNTGPIVGPGTITVPALTIRADGPGRTWTIDGASVQQDAGSPLGFAGTALSVRGGTASDTFNLTPHPSIAITVSGFDPDPPVLPGDHLRMNLAGATVANLSSSLTASGYNGTWTFTNRAPVSFSAIESAPATTLAVLAPANATAGTPISVTVSAIGAFNQVDTTYSGTVHFTSTDGGALLPANTMLVNGTGTFPVTMITPGNYAVTATDTVTASITGTSGTISTVAGPATHFVVTAPANATAGGSFTFGVVARDVGNNVANGYAGTVHFTSTDGTATLPADAMLTNGIGSFNATLNASGNYTITATDTVTPGITGTSGSINTSLKTYSSASATGSGTITATFTGGGVGCSFTAPQMIGAPPGAFPVPPTKPAPNAEFPHGMFDFQLTGCTVGSTVTMSITYPSRPGTLWKYGPEIGSPVAHWYKMPATVAGNTVTYTMTDGGVGDDDLAANGTFVDPVGPAFVPDNPIPTLSQWMLLLLAMLVLGGGIHSRKR